MLGIWESIVIGIAILIAIFWLGKKAPDMAKNTAKTIKEFKKEMKKLPEEIDEIKKEIKE